MVDELIAALRAEFEALADPARAPAMAAYMKEIGPFLGVAAPIRRQAQRRAVDRLGGRSLRPSERELAGLLQGLWAEPEREFHYAACDLVHRWAKGVSAGFLGQLERALVTKSWWDTVDGLAPAVGRLVVAHPELQTVLDRWNHSPDRWLVRVSIIHQLGDRGATDEAVLFRRCAAQSGHRDFFVRKAIGWALRDYARTSPDAVAAFVASHPDLSGLSRREALKHLR